MNRFRKKSDAKRAVQALDALREAQVARVTQHQQPSPLPPLPPASDFRTSLILPDLTRRFSVLRNSAGEPIGIDELKSRFAEQRARGSEHRVSEEEEDMILEALGRLRGASRSKGTVDDTAGDDRVSTAFSETQDGGSRISAVPSFTGGQSVRSNVTATTTSSALHGSPSVASLTSSTGKGSHAGRRMSNNLFGSGKFHDHTYMRAAHQRRAATPSSNPRSATARYTDSEASISTVTSRAVGHSTSVYSDNQSLRPVSPDGSTSASSVPSSPNQAPVLRESDSLPHVLPPEVLGRASLALDAVIRELEEEGDDEIVMERSPVTTVPSPIHTSAVNNLGYSGSMARPPPDTSRLSSSPPISPTDHEPDSCMALSSDEPSPTIVETYRTSSSPYPRGSTSSPAQRVPGYVPGMPRPMTPLDRDTSFDTDDLTPSTTPRPTSPRLPSSSSTPAPPSLAQTWSSNMYSSSSPAPGPRTSISPSLPALSTPPLFVSRSTNGRFTPEDPMRSRTNNSSGSGSSSSLLAQNDESPTYGRRRPTSPLSAPSYQPIPATNAPSSRPSTPSNVTWLPPSTPDGSRGHVRNGHGSTSSTSGRSRNGSQASLSDPVTSSYETDRTAVGINGSSRLNTATRSVRSPDPASPVSTWYDNRQASTTSLNGPMDIRSSSAMSSSLDPGSPTRPYRSPTPNPSGRNNTTSPASAIYSEQNGYTNGATSSRRTSRQHTHSSFALSPAQALLLSPMGNSSRSSLESAGSSYHSWDEDHRKDRLFDLFTHLDPTYTEWHDLSAQNSTSQTTPSDSQDTYEETVRSRTGLTKFDVLAVQDKLVSAALTKAATPEGRNRANSVRRRRPSTSQSNYSVTGAENRVASPTPQVQAPTAPTRLANSDQIALLDSVVDSIQSPRTKATSVLPVDDSTVIIQTPPEPVASSPGQRHRALADALFGTDDPELPIITSPTTRPAPLFPDSTLPSFAEEKPSIPAVLSFGPGNEYVIQTPSVSEVAPAVTSPMAVPSGHAEPTSLELEVQRRIEAATAALRKSPSIPKLDGGSNRRRISPNQISSPKLVSASTSVDTIPLSAVNPGQQRTIQPPPSTRLGSRFKILRGKGTLRAKPPIGMHEEGLPSSAEARSPLSAQIATYNPEAFGIRDQLAVSSATESGRFKISPPPVASPPASAGPGLRGFMSRFRKQRPGEMVSPNEKLNAESRTPTTASLISAGSRLDPPRSSIDSQAKSAPAGQSQFAALRPLSPQSPLSRTFAPSIPEDSAPPPASAPLPEANEALKQLYDAGKSLGLDEAALHALVARSPSVTSRTTTWSKVTRNNSKTAGHQTTRPDIRDGRSPQPPLLLEGRPSIDASSPRPSTEIKHLSVRKHAEPSSTLRGVLQATTDPLRTVVRRTIILPSDSAQASATDLNALIRKQTTSQRRRSAGAGSVSSNKSLQDRAPTPPPPRSIGGRRFSTDRSPPVPHLPQSLSTNGNALLPPAQVEKSNSTYDSLFDMYAGDSKGTNPANSDVLVAGSSQQGDALPEAGQALEVIELANGETIWSIVNGLRDDDTDSFFDNRQSFASEYSGEGVKVSFKEHGRKSSKSSNASFLSRKKVQQPISASQRPETKVFFSSSTQIARLIENMSRDVDAGSFNITPDRAHSHAGHSVSSSVGSAAEWTLEERLEHMLGAVSANP
ncbi:hypothetical protein PHLGIDRAFT_35191 [Phlebiopsis gigantea 11061_1 CR5-6]|uniref:Uncharacterized protein n=1 Tax=Phlebiopsis gigantea (strain 11061_1 CR5-6) TaxID=745531 RepID=A0A0C3RZS9_PHLG1|nr:hypothetical protein PHLGIDRAFT_35191 [Phlebiopsis gigantea 11061_1 CR5-6]